MSTCADQHSFMCRFPYPPKTKAWPHPVQPTSVTPVLRNNASAPPPMPLHLCGMSSHAARYKNKYLIFFVPPSSVSLVKAYCTAQQSLVKCWLPLFNSEPCALTGLTDHLIACWFWCEWLLVDSCLLVFRSCRTNLISIWRVIEKLSDRRLWIQVGMHARGRAQTQGTRHKE